MSGKLTGLIAAVHTPMHADGSINPAIIPPLVNYLCGAGVSGLYVGGSTGEGVSLTVEERRAVAEAYIAAAGQRLPVVIQVGHNSLGEARTLARHAQEAGAAAISSTSPSYFKPDSVAVLVDCMAEVASAAPDLPFYYYHIPQLTGTAMDMVAFLEKGGERIPNLRGIKFSELYLATYQACLEYAGGRFDILWGCDEMLLSALAVGAQGAVGSTFNFMAPLYLRVMAAFREGELDEARRTMHKAVEIVRLLNGTHAPLHPAMKRTMSFIGFDCGPSRRPQASIAPAAADALRADLEALGLKEIAHTRECSACESTR